MIGCGLPPPSSVLPLKRSAPPRAFRTCAAVQVPIDETPDEGGGR
ncbi:hypothetical protein HMPREF0762_01560 [Slackia exigua ATCC 700122]|uniref:Uncharacterized protein n=1 Tax=Slackia exigua (strain ATCC 700122 / DSM 15923 / CIP 105133 / JCM 11022 / KCTC 5966 / S-7) TaxID=649764 RepID=D0WI88_SLAES|nr:hypothetical protein HMPREF0762_01560 [Slackia exigua ATCC 700122]